LTAQDSGSVDGWYSNFRTLTVGALAGDADAIAETKILFVGMF
jgi:hypothetical protein